MTLAQLLHWKTRTRRPDRVSETSVLNVAGMLQSQHLGGELTISFDQLGIGMGERICR
jgi:hypothetical protein